MVGFLIFIHIMVCLLLVMVILLQSSKGSGLAGAFGGSGGVGAVFGGRGAATFLSKLTTILAVLYMLSSISHSMISSGSRASKSIVQKEAQQSGRISPAAQLPAIPGAVQEAQGTQNKQTQPASSLPNAEQGKVENKK
jgi:preprotein translocase subunit SecG